MVSTTWAAVCNVVVWSILAIYVSAQPGFLSLDCGGNRSHSDENGIQWVPDDDFIKTGSSSPVSYADERFFHLEIFQRLRFFQETDRKHCYELPVEASETYLIRCQFWYGNYDGQHSSSALFDIIVDGNVVSIANISLTDYNIYYRECIVKASSETLDLCLGSRSPQRPVFISTLEMRHMGKDVYKEFLSSSTEALETKGRIDLGANDGITVRYPFDSYDRYWESDKYMNSTWKDYAKISTTSSINTSTAYAPLKVMQTAITSNSTIVIEDSTLPSAYYYFIFYFAETIPIENSTIVEFNFSLYINLSTVFGNATYNLTSDLSTFGAVRLYFNHPVLISGPSKLIFARTERSTRGPILNAVELFQYYDNLKPATDPNERKALTNLMNHFNLSGWSGDPCIPQGYKWTWISCSNETRVTELNLSNYGLKGVIPQIITQLVHLKKIYLNDNYLEGHLINFESLINLTVLHLQNNNLTGVVPQNLAKINDILIYNNSFDCVPKSLATSFRIKPKICKNSARYFLIFQILFPLVLAAILFGLIWIYRNNIWSFLIAKNLDQKNKGLTFNEVINATTNFKTKIGEGSFGSVFYGRLNNGDEVAVKVKSDLSKQGKEEFDNEVDILSIVYHRNIVRFLGFCEENHKLILIYEFLSNGSLKDHLYGTKRMSLSWRNRVGIAMDVAQGIEYLHNLCHLHIIHRDIKTSNILLSSSMEAKISDLGLSKFKNQGDSSYISTQVKGTIGYLDPEYNTSGRLTQKSDIFSFGVVLFELICGREPIDITLTDDNVSLLKWARNQIKNGDLQKIVDPKLQHYTEQSVWKLLEVAVMCTEYDSASRPTIDIVVNEIKESVTLDKDGSDTYSMKIDEPR